MKDGELGWYASIMTFRKNFFVQCTHDGGITWDAAFWPTRSIIKALRMVPLTGEFRYRIVRRRMGGKFTIVWSNQKESEKLFIYPII